jgi:hypothetical protein
MTNWTPCYAGLAACLLKKLEAKKETNSRRRTTKTVLEIEDITRAMADVVKVGDNALCRDHIEGLDHAVYAKKFSGPTRKFLKSIEVGND